MTIFTFIGHIQTVRIDKATYVIDHREKCNKKIYFYTIFNFGNQMIVTSGLTLGRTIYILNFKFYFCAYGVLNSMQIYNW